MEQTLGSLMNSYEEKYKISAGQIAYIEKLLQKQEISNVGEWLTNNFNRKISAINELKPVEVKRTISLLCKDALLNKTQLKEIKFQYPNLDKLSLLINRELQDWSDLRYSDYMFLNKKPSEWKMASKETSLIIKRRYEFGWQLSKYCRDLKMWYLKFNDFLMVDLDVGPMEDESTIEENLIWSDLRRRIERFPELSVRIYRTYNGLHLFILNQPIEHRSQASLILMESLKCDEFYRRFSYQCGFKVRLSPKITRDEPYVAKYWKTYAGGKEVSAEFGLNNSPNKSMVIIHDSCLALFQDTIHCDGFLIDPTVQETILPFLTKN